MRLTWADPGVAADWSSPDREGAAPSPMLRTRCSMRPSSPTPFTELSDRPGATADDRWAEPELLAMSASNARRCARGMASGSASDADARLPLGSVVIVTRDSPEARRGAPAAGERSFPAVASASRRLPWRPEVQREDWLSRNDDGTTVLLLRPERRLGGGAVRVVVVTDPSGMEAFRPVSIPVCPADGTRGGRGGRFVNGAARV